MLEQCTGIIEIMVYTQSRFQSLPWNVSKKALECFKTGGWKIWLQLNSCAWIANWIWIFLDLSGVSLSPYCLQRKWELWETRLSLYRVILRDSYLYLGLNKEIMGTVGTSEILEFGQLVNSCWSRFLPVTCLSHPVHWVLPLGLWRLMPEIKLCNHSEVFDPYWVISHAIFFKFSFITITATYWC